MLIFERLPDAYAIDGVTAVEQNWKATDDLTGVYVSKSYPIAEAEATIKADLTALFPANPAVDASRLETLKAIKVGNSIQIVDENGKPVISISRDALGNAGVAVVDSNGNKRRVLVPQSGTVKSDGAATITDVAFDQEFTEHPVVTVSPSEPLPNHKLRVSKTGFTMDFATAPTGTIAWEAKGGKRN